MGNADLTIIFYTANRVKPQMLELATRALLEAAGDYPIISVSQQPMTLGHNLCLGDLGFNAWNIYYQLLHGTREAKTRYVATAEDDVLYPYAHYHEARPTCGNVLYDMNRWSLFTWKAPEFTYKASRAVLHQLICERDLLVAALEERLRACPSPTARRVRFVAEPGRAAYEAALGITEHKLEKFYASQPSVVFNHEEAVGFQQVHGKHKASGRFGVNKLAPWGLAEDLLAQVKRRNHGAN